MSDPSESFEEALTLLEESVERLEAGDLKLEEALAVFEQGVAASRTFVPSFFLEPLSNHLMITSSSSRSMSYL